MPGKPAEIPRLCRRSNAIYEAVDAERPDGPMANAHSIAMNHYNIGHTWYMQGNLPAAMAAFESAIRVCEEALRRGDESGMARHDLARALVYVCRSRLNSGRCADAVEPGRRAIAIYREPPRTIAAGLLAGGAALPGPRGAGLRLSGTEAPVRRDRLPRSGPRDAQGRGRAAQAAWSRAWPGFRACWRSSISTWRTSTGRTSGGTTASTASCSTRLTRSATSSSWSSRCRTCSRPCCSTACTSGPICGWRTARCPTRHCSSGPIGSARSCASQQPWNGSHRAMRVLLGLEEADELESLGRTAEASKARERAFAARARRRRGPVRGGPGLGGQRGVDRDLPDPAGRPADDRAPAAVRTTGRRFAPPGGRRRLPRCRADCGTRPGSRSSGMTRNSDPLWPRSAIAFSPRIRSRRGREGAGALGTRDGSGRRPPPHRLGLWRWCLVRDRQEETERGTPQLLGAAIVVGRHSACSFSRRHAVDRS